MADKIMKTLTMGGNTYEIYDETARTQISTFSQDLNTYAKKTELDKLSQEIDGLKSNSSNGSAGNTSSSEMVFKIFKQREVFNRNSTFLVPKPIEKSSFQGKKIVCIGDSITYGYGVGTGYVKNLGTELGATMVNHGVSSTVLCTGGHRTCNIGKLTADNLKGADYVTILMGINDFDQAKDNYYTLGDINSTDTTNIYGALKMWCDKIMELKATSGFTNTKFYFMTPLITSWNNSMTSARNWDQNKTNVHGYTLRDLCQAIIDVCDMYSIPVIDLNLYSGIYYHNENDENVSLYGGDGIHPNDAGHVLIAESIIRALCRNPEYVNSEEALNYSLNYLLALISKEQGTEIPYPVVVEGSATRSSNSSSSNKDIAITGITLSNSSITITAGSTYTVKATLVPSNTTQTNIEWSSSNESVAKVNGGVITAISNGTAIITCKSVDNPLIKATVSLTVEQAESSDLTALIISEEATTVYEGNKKVLSVTYVPANTEQTGIVWETTDSNVATIEPSSNGKTCVVTAVNVGQCYIKATSTVNPDITTQCFFTTSEIPPAADIEDFTFELSNDVTWDASTGVMTCSNSEYESLLNNNGTSNTAVLNQPLRKGQEIEVQLDTLPDAKTYSGENVSDWSIAIIGLDRQNSISNVALDTSYKFPQPDVNIYFDHPGKEQLSGNSICMFRPNSRLSKSTLNTCVHDSENTGLRVVYKRNNDGVVSATVNGIDVSFDNLRSTHDTIGLADNADELYLVVTGLSTYVKMTVKYSGHVR